MTSYFLLLLPLAAALGWLICWYQYRDHFENLSPRHWSREYFTGLNYLLNEEPDKAVDVFIKMIEVDNETVETHLALGNLFRRRGEVDRAIRIHQNLIARPQLTKQQRLESLLELGQDYLRAGVFDRAERLFVEIIESDERQPLALKLLLTIYEQEKDWQQAILTAEKMQAMGGENKQIEIAQYYCELADIAKQQGCYEVAADYLKRSARTHRHCARASLIQAALARQTQQYTLAIKWYKRAFKQDPDWMVLVIESFMQCFEAIGNKNEGIDFLKNYLQEHHDSHLIAILSEKLIETDGLAQAEIFMTDAIKKYPSLKGLFSLLDLRLNQVSAETDKTHLKVWRHICDKLLENKPIYRCHHCGFFAKLMYWQCPSCRHWETVRPIHRLVELAAADSSPD